jgi:uncharacterized membrane protein
MKLWLKKGLPIAAVIMFGVVLAVSAPSLLKSILTLPLVLFLPGFALSILLFKRDALGIPERLLISVGLSVALSALIGLILNWTPWGLQPATLGIALLVVMAVEIVGIIFIRREWFGVTSLPINPAFTLRQWILVSLAALVTVIAVNMARAPVEQQGLEGYTTLWVQASDAPDMVRLGVRCEEFETTKYQIRFEVNKTLYEGPILELKPGETWDGRLEVPSDKLAGKPLTVFLYRLDNPTEVYRHAVWWPQ